MIMAAYLIIFYNYLIFNVFTQFDEDTLNIEFLVIILSIFEANFISVIDVIDAQEMIGIGLPSKRTGSRFWMMVVLDACQVNALSAFSVRYLGQSYSKTEIRINQNGKHYQNHAGCLPSLR